MHLRMPGTWDNTGLEGYVYYGLGEDVALAYVLTYDTFVLRFRMKWLEKFAMPPIDIYYADNMQQFIPNLRRIVDSTRGESSTTIPRPAGDKFDDWFHIEQRQVPSPSYDAMAAFSEEWTRPRINAILLGESWEKKKQGGFSNNQQEQESGPQVWFEWDSTNISQTITEQLVPAIIQMGPASINILPPSCFPIFTLEATEVKDVMKEIGVAKNLATLVPIATQELYERSGYRIPQDGEETVGGIPEPMESGSSLIGADSQINASGEMKPNAKNDDNNPNHGKQNPVDSPKNFPKPREPQGHNGDQNTIAGGRKAQGMSEMPRITS